jgi:tRNA-guanine family transglycosylase
MFRVLLKNNPLSKMSSPALNFQVTHTCSTTKARVGRLTLGRNHTSRGPIETPVFMPVGTQGTLKGLTPEQLHQLNCRIILGNTVVCKKSWNKCSLRINDYSN